MAKLLLLEPHSGAGVALILPDEDGVWHGQQPDQRPVLEEAEDLALVSQTLIDADLLNLKSESSTPRDKFLRKSGGSPTFGWKMTNGLPQPEGKTFGRLVTSEGSARRPIKPF